MEWPKLLEPLCGYSLIRASKLGSGRSDLLDTSFLRQVGHSLFLQRQGGHTSSETKIMWNPIINIKCYATCILKWIISVWVCLKSNNHFKRTSEKLRESNLKMQVLQAACGYVWVHFARQRITDVCRPFLWHLFSNLSEFMVKSTSEQMPLLTGIRELQTNKQVLV